LAVVLLEVPPLRERGADVVLLAQHSLQRAADAYRLSPKRLDPQAEVWLQQYTWPGNVRELGHLMERVTLRHTEFAPRGLAEALPKPDKHLSAHPAIPPDPCIGASVSSLQRRCSWILYDPA